MPTSLTEEEFENLTDILAGATENESKLTPWEEKFVADFTERTEKWGRKIFVSDKQWMILQRIQRKFE